MVGQCWPLYPELRSKHAGKHCIEHLCHLEYYICILYYHICILYIYVNFIYEYIIYIYYVYYIYNVYIYILYLNIYICILYVCILYICILYIIYIYVYYVYIIYICILYICSIYGLYILYMYIIYMYIIYMYIILYICMYMKYMCVLYICVLYIYVYYIYICIIYIYILHIVNYIYNVCVCARVIICIHPSLSLYLSPYLCSRSCASPSSRTLGHGIPLTLFAGNIICSVFMVSPLPPVPCGAGWGGGGVAYVVWEYKIAGTSQYFTWGQPENEPQLIGSQVSHGRLGWHTSDTSVVAITDRPQRGIDLMPCEAIVARLLAAPGAGWHTAKLVFALDLRSRHPPEPEKISQIFLKTIPQS